MKRRWWEKFLKSHLKFMFASFANTGAHGTSIFSYDGIRTLQCHYFPSVGPAGLNPSSSMIFFDNRCSVLLSLYIYIYCIGLYMPGCEYSLLFILSLALNPTLYILISHIIYYSTCFEPLWVLITDPSSSFWITKGGRMWLQFISLFSQDPLASC